MRKQNPKWDQNVNYCRAQGDDLKIVAILFLNDGKCQFDFELSVN